MTRTDPRVVRSRAAVLAAATQLLATDGVAGTTIEAVAARSGVAKTTIYRHWPDQRALVRDAFGVALPMPAAPDTGTLAGDLLALATGLARALADSPADADAILDALAGPLFHRRYVTGGPLDEGAIRRAADLACHSCCQDRHRSA
ncbi:TetR/AcrR family transcriptional regulator [Isoptericola sp. b441]|uniref:TetR/AcrR family transcriptional regulator n=1 Tax=Actinotalea lenta TaxID=3064654 RepID=A0ABT9D8Z2_9CELL|nr:TetR/AcrR family transcriptional regulator [Isoptericola sp. b441]MDO8105643.1 TetR/AcrR family transcriptional regulator [Isoptericola sp. b441]